MSADASSARDPLDLLIERFLELHRAGEPVTPETFAEQHPEHEQQLLDLLPTLLALEDVKRERASSGSSQQRVSLPKLERLGDFRIDRELGRGGMGVVFEAVQESLDRRVALKVMPQASLLTGNQLERFRREAQIAARLHHTNIVPVYGSGESDGYHWYAMQFIQGQSLDRWRETQSAQPPQGSGQWASRARFVARIGAAAAGALHCAHGLGTLHRDIKPGNFLLDHEDNLWVTDFGLAKALESEGLTNSGDLLGTLQYMAPEQFAGSYDVRSEVYALGVTLYELLTLHPAFQGRHRSELMELVREHRVEALERTCPDVPQDLAVIIGKAMARDPRDRYQDAQALQQDLEAFLEDRPIMARRPSTLSLVLRWCRRNRGMSAAIAAAAVAIVGAAVSGWAFYGVAQDALQLAQKEGQRAENNLRLSLDAFGDVFDALVGRDPVLDFEADPDTGEETVVVQSAVSQRDVVLLQEMLAFYDRFANENATSQSLRYETARANRRVGAIHAQLGEPKSLEVARESFERALEGFANIDDRDVRRDRAEVHIDLGLLSARRRSTREATEHFQRALALLQELPAADTPAIRLRRATVLFELYRSKHRRYRRREGPWGSMEFVAAMAMLGRLLDEDGDDPEVRALHARCLREDARGPDGRVVEDEVVAIFRSLATEHPERLEFRFEYCQAVMARRGRGASLSELAAADEMAAQLVAAQPLFREYRSMLLRVRTRYAGELYRSSQRLEGEERAARAQLAHDRIRAALVVGERAVQDDLRDPRFFLAVLGGRGTLGKFLLADGDRDAALEQARLAMDLFERHYALRKQDGEAEGPPPGEPGQRPRGAAGPGSRRRPDRTRPGQGMDGVDWELWGEFGELVMRLQDPELRERMRKLFSRR